MMTAALKWIISTSDLFEDVEALGASRYFKDVFFPKKCVYILANVVCPIMFNKLVSSIF